MTQKFLSSIQSYLPKDGLVSTNPFIMICDCETTGYSEKQHDLISFSAKVCDFNLDIKDEITIYARPSKERWTWQAEKIHKISLAEALTFPEPRKAGIQFLHFIKHFKSEKNDPLLFVSHDNGSFDYRFFKSFFINCLLVDSYEKIFKDEYKLSTINMARKLGHKNNGLDVWAKKLNLELNHHEVKSDTDACFEVFKHILENTSVQQELEVS